MTKSILRVAPLIICLTYAAMGCGGEGGGCGGGESTDTGPKLTCGRGTHQEGSACVSNPVQPAR